MGTWKEAACMWAGLTQKTQTGAVSPVDQVSEELIPQSKTCLGKNLSGEKMTNDCSRLQLSFQPPRRDVVPSTGNINEPRKVRQTDI